MTSWKLALAAVLLILGSVARAALIPYTANGVKLVFDDDFGPEGITWLADANLAASETFGVTGISPNGMMEGWTAQYWRNAMNDAHYGGVANKDAYTRWHLWVAWPSIADNMFSHLFYAEGGLSTGEAINQSPALTAMFSNMQEFMYWSESPTTVGDYFWTFDTSNGTIIAQTPSHVPGYAWPIYGGRIADIPLPAVPLPGTLTLVALGLFGLDAGRRLSRAT
jgi:hypothetical protein